MKNKVSTLVGIIFICMGLFFFFINRFMIREFSKELENQKDAVATITSIDEDVYFTFEDENGKNYTVKSNYESSSMQLGDKLNIHYNSKNPRIARVDIKEFGDVFNYIFCSASGLLIFIGLFSILLGRLETRGKNKLLREGLMLSASIIGVECNKYINMNGRHPYIIRASFTYNGETYETKSENMWINPQYILDSYSIRELPVYINTENPKSNILDITDIKNRLGK